MKFRVETNTLKGLLLHTSIVLALFCILSFTVFYTVLPSVTNKGKVVTVPDLKGMTVDEAIEFLTDKKLKIGVIDSSYSREFAPLTILEQFPQPNSRVKPDRKVDLKLNAKTPPTIPFPDLVGSTFDFAQRQLTRVDLKIGTIEHRPDIAHNTILESRLKGQQLSTGQRVAKGSTIDLVIGIHKGRFALPDFKDMPFDEAEAYILGMNLKLKQVHHLKDDNTVAGIIKRQKPNAGDTVRLGDQVELWVVNEDQ